MLLSPRGFPSRLAIRPRNLPLSSSRLYRGYDKALSWRSKVEQVTEPAGGIFSRPAVQLDLHLPYREVSRVCTRPRHDTGIHRRIFGHYILSLTDTLPPFPRCTGFPRLGVLRRLRPTRAFGRRRAYPARPSRRKGGRGTHAGGSRVHCCPVDGLGIRLCPCGFATATAAGNSPWPPDPGPEYPARSSPPVTEGRVRTAIQPESTGLELARGSRGVTTPVPCVYLPVLAHRTRPIRQYRADATLSRLLPSSPATPGLDCLQLAPCRCGGAEMDGLSPPSGTPAPRGALRLPPASPHRHDGGKMDGLSPPSVNDSASWRTQAPIRSRPAGQRDKAGDGRRIVRSQQIRGSRISVRPSPHRQGDRHDRPRQGDRPVAAVRSRGKAGRRG